MYLLLLQCFVLTTSACSTGGSTKVDRKSNSTTNIGDEFPVSETQSNLSSDPVRIVGGQDAYQGAIPFIVRLFSTYKDGKSYRCGGSLISTKTVLTAAHCLYGNLSKAYAILGESEVNVEEKGKVTIPVCSYKVHELYNDKSFDETYDIGFAYLFTEAVPSNVIQVAHIAVHAPHLFSSGVYVAGWGTTEDDLDPNNRGLSSKLQYASVQAYSPEVCKKEHNIKTIGQIICALGTKKNAKGYKADACEGDSGGPLFAHQVDPPIYILFGIVIGATDSCGAWAGESMGTYADAIYLKKYIEKNTDAGSSTCTLEVTGN